MEKFNDIKSHIPIFLEKKLEAQLTMYKIRQKYIFTS